MSRINVEFGPFFTPLGAPTTARVNVRTDRPVRFRNTGDVIDADDRLGVHHHVFALESTDSSDVDPSDFRYIIAINGVSHTVDIPSALDIHESVNIKDIISGNVPGSNSGGGNGVRFRELSQAEYDSIVKDPAVLYLIPR